MTDSDEKKAAMCVCCGEAKSKFYSITSKKFALYEIGNQAIYSRTIRGVTSGERFKKNFYCGVYEVISLRKWPSSYDCTFFRLYLLGKIL